MASNTESQERSSFIDDLINSRNPDFSLLVPLILGLNHRLNPNQETGDQESGGSSRDRVILINPFTRTTVIIENSTNSSSSLGFDSLIDELFSRKSGLPPASKASIDALPSVEIVDDDDDEHCVVCLEDWECGEKAKEMPCKHKFHGVCIEKWLKIHGSCPVCRYEMPVDEADDDEKKRRREILMDLGFSSSSVSDRRTGENETSDSFTSHQEE